MTAVHWRQLTQRRYHTPDQGWLTQTISQPLGGLLAAAAFKLRMGPNLVTLIGLLLMLLACLPFVSGTGWSDYCLAAMIWQLGFAFDCADGQLARATGKSSGFGAWLDIACDHVRQISVGASILLISQEQGLIWGGWCAGLLLVGLTVYLHTVTAIKGALPTGDHASVEPGFTRKLIRALLDTPLFLLILPALRCYPRMLFLFCALYGAVQLARAFAIARSRLGHNG